MREISNKPIGIFDSGVGGLTIVKEVIKVMPNEDIIYFGDTARVPYGSKSKEIVYKFSSQIIRFLKEKKVKAIIIACNTVSSNCYDDLKSEFMDIPIIEVITSGVKSATIITKNQKIGVIGTYSTIKSTEYEKKLKKKSFNIEVYSKACPLFVPIVEEGLFEGNITTSIVKMYLNELIENNIDTLILACTHYPLLKETIKKAIPQSIEIVDPAIETALEMKRYLIDNNMQNIAGGKYKFFISDENDKFSFICSLLLKNNYKAEKVDIEKY